MFLPSHRDTVTNPSVVALVQCLETGFLLILDAWTKHVSQFSIKDSSTSSVHDPDGTWHTDKFENPLKRPHAAWDRIAKEETLPSPTIRSSDIHSNDSAQKRHVPLHEEEYQHSRHRCLGQHSDAHEVGHVVQLVECRSWTCSATTVLFGFPVIYNHAEGNFDAAEIGHVANPQDLR